MGSGPRIVLQERKPERNDGYKYISAFKFFNPLRDDVWNTIVVATPEKPIDGKYVILLLENRAQVRIEHVHGVIGIVDECENVEQRTHDIAKKLAEQRAKVETYGWYNDKRGVPFADETSRAKESILVAI
ncbi:hypothetical protein J4217_04145 [Candidatus Pacearchaeota archaeon]|nr:hypothetical protein [Candidatus Pacearchaeota archaeon]